MKQDIYLRAHTVPVGGHRNKSGSSVPMPIWPKSVLIFDTETTIDQRQDLTFGAYTLYELKDGKYISSEDGLFYRDDLDVKQRSVVMKYVKTERARIEVQSFPPRLDLKMYPRWQFVEKVFWKAIKEERMIVGFNLPFDLTRIAVDWAAAENGGWSLVLSKRLSKKLGVWEAHPYRPRVRVTAKDSKSAFISLTRSQIPVEWPKQSRFLDVHTLASALFAESLSLEELCCKLKIPGKMKHEPTGKVTAEEVDYCRGDVKATARALNALKEEFDQHGLDLSPDRAYSPASMVKSYLAKMGLKTPLAQFDVPHKLHGIAMQAYYGGRAECRVRHTAVPVVHTDFKSQYPTVNTLLGNWDILTSGDISFDLATEEVRALLANVTLDCTFDPSFWRRISFFALVLADEDILPVRTIYNGQTQNIGINKLSSESAIWFAGPDLIVSALLRGKPPKIIKAIRLTPDGKQSELAPTRLCGTVPVDPSKDDFFLHVTEQRERHKSDPILGRFLKTLGNSGSYGLFVEITPEVTKRPKAIQIFSGEEFFEQEAASIEVHGKWYFPPIASLITAGGRLLLAMVEKSVAERNGTYLFCDTDSMCIVASEHGGRIDCETADETPPIEALSWREVEGIQNRFRRLNPYNPSVIPDLLKIEDINFDSIGRQRQVFGYAISAKRYVLFENYGSDLNILEPKAHGLGYLYPPVDKRDDEPHWSFEAWGWLLRTALGFACTEPHWFDLPAMMRIVMSTPHVVRRLNKISRPYNFLFCPLIDSICGYPAGVDRQQFTLITPFTKNRKAWLTADCINIYDGKHYSLALLQTPQFDRIIPKTFGYIMRLYGLHRECKSLGPDGMPCVGDTRGLLQRMHVTADRLRFIGKETDRKWERGEDLSLLAFKPTLFEESSKTVKADSNTMELLALAPIKAVAREAEVDRNTVRKVLRGLPVRALTLQRIVAAVARLQHS
jgi:hypothetical protein